MNNQTKFFLAESARRKTEQAAAAEREAAEQATRERAELRRQRLQEWAEANPESNAQICQDLGVEDLTAPGAFGKYGAAFFLDDLRNQAREPRNANKDRKFRKVIDNVLQALNIRDDTKEEEQQIHRDGVRDCPTCGTEQAKRSCPYPNDQVHETCSRQEWQHLCEFHWNQHNSLVHAHSLERWEGLIAYLERNKDLFTELVTRDVVWNHQTSAMTATEQQQATKRLLRSCFAVIAVAAGLTPGSAEYGTEEKSYLQQFEQCPPGTLLVPGTCMGLFGEDDERVGPFKLSFVSVWTYSKGAQSLEEEEALHQEHEARLEDFQNQFNVKIDGWYASDSGTLLCSTDVQPGYDYFPQGGSWTANAFVMGEDRDNPSGVISQIPLSNWAKIVKSWRSFFAHRMFGTLVSIVGKGSHIPLNAEKSLVVHVNNSGLAGSGGAMMKRSAYIWLLKATSRTKLTRKDKQAVSAYIGFATRDMAGKCQANIVDDDKFPKTDEEGNTIHPLVNFICDSDNFNDRIRRLKDTAIHVRPNHRMGKNSTLQPIEALHHLYALITHLGVPQLCNVAGTEASALADLMEHTLGSEDHTGKFGPASPESQIDQEAERLRLLYTWLARRNPAEMAYWYCGPYANPDTAGQIVGADYNSWYHKLKGKTLPVIVISAWKSWLTDFFYAGVEEPAQGYAEVLFDHDHKPWGLVVNRKDFKDSVKMLQDGYDGDDSAVTLLLKFANGGYGILVLRLPLTPGGGSVHRISDDTARQLMDCGYVPYELIGEDPLAKLFDSVDGELIHPEVLTSTPLEPVSISLDGSDAVKAIAYVTQFRALYGKIINRVFTLQYSGLYKPEKHWFINSNALDATLNLTGDPTPIAETLLEDLLDDLIRGEILDPCIADRCKRDLQGLWRARGHKEYMPWSDAECTNPDHLQIKKTMRQIMDMMKGEITRNQFPANGYPADLLAAVDPAVAEEARNCVSARGDTRFVESKMRYQIQNDDSLGREEREQKLEDNRNWSKTRIEKLVAGFYAEAVQAAEANGGYELGSFMRAFIQFSIQAPGRWNPGEDNWGEFRIPEIRDTGMLPQEEQEAFYKDHWTPAPPTAILEATKAGANCFEEGDIFTLVDDHPDPEKKKTLFQARRVSDGQWLCNVKKFSGSVCEGYTLKLAGATHQYGFPLRQSRAAWLLGSASKETGYQWSKETYQKAETPKKAQIDLCLVAEIVNADGTALHPELRTGWQWANPSEPEEYPGGLSAPQGWDDLDWSDWVNAAAETMSY